MENARVYECRPVVAPTLLTPPAGVVQGSFSFGAYDAAKKWVKEHLPTYEVIPGGQPLHPVGRKFNAIDHSAGLGADIYVLERS